jgi:hypothetical protein
MSPGAHLAGVGAERAITSADAPGKPAATTRSLTLGSSHHAADLSGELLPDGIEEPYGPVADGERRRSSTACSNAQILKKHADLWERAGRMLMEAWRGVERGVRRFHHVVCRTHLRHLDLYVPLSSSAP